MNSPKNFDFNFITKVLSDELRINILNLLKEKGEMNTTEIAKAFDKKLASIFYHLDLMQQANIVTIRNEGRKVIYNLNIQFFENLGTYIKTFSTNDNVML
ncbi:MAG: hypothetical protein A2Y17_00635 [Clostridiales bacterium GWF2_38_85]|nr:MAG: hypothetical protein A2Y17_00635 [Clostridiales bacterium GWF2_38_85]